MFRWAEQGTDPLRYYACGLLAAGMEVQDVSSTYRASNAALFPHLLAHLHQLNDAVVDQSLQIASDFSGLIQNGQVNNTADADEEPRPSTSNDVTHATNGPVVAHAVPAPNFSIRYFLNLFHLSI